jgi:hypothetical protein
VRNRSRQMARELGRESEAMGTRLLSLGNSGGIRFWLERQARADRPPTRVDAGIRPAMAFGDHRHIWFPT